MYGKIFRQIYASSIAQDYKVRHIFMDLIVLADAEGIVDMTLESIAGFTRVPIDDLRSAVAILEKPDRQSRTPDHEGARLIRLDEHRNWGWRIVNYVNYRGIKDETSRKDYIRNYMREYRKSPKNKDLPVNVYKSLHEFTSPSSYTSTSSSSKEGGTGGRSMALVKEGLVALYDRKPTAYWSNLEEQALFEVCKRPDCVEELADLRNYQRSNSQYFPKSIASLLTDWTKHLDAAASHKREKKHIVHGVDSAEIALRKKQAKEAYEKAKNYVP